jgi:hypothetical protein
MERPANEVWQPVHVPPQAKGVARTGGLGQIRLKFLSTLDCQAKLDWNQAFLDGSFVPGKKATVLNVKGAEHQESRFVDV